MEEEIEKEINQLKKEVENNGKEEFVPKVIISNNKQGEKLFKQYKLNLPKEYLDIISKKEINTQGSYDPKQNKLTIEIWS
ncbi:MAG: hypothetical protein U9Q73_02065 [Nanoarchaeota archaeon]|nr:hypothetical protein [Nanoarchaeota archaeon]